MDYLKKQNNILSYQDQVQYLTKLYKSQVLHTQNFPIEIHLILSYNCNLNCTNCQALCNIHDKNEFMTLQEIQFALPILKEFFNNSIYSIVLFGGEPLLNPEYKEICKYIREILPDTNISIYTNGLILQNWTEFDYQFAKELNIKFILTLYPLIDYIPKIEKQDKLMTELGIDHRIDGCRPYFVKGGYNLTGTSDPSRFFTCCHCIFPPAFYLYKTKLYRCAVSLRLHELGAPYIQEDFLDINNLNKQKFLEYCSKPLEICKYCSTMDQFDFGSDEIIIWHQQNQLKSDYSHALIDLYVNDYQTYYKYVHDCKDILPLFDNEYFLSQYYGDELPSNPFDIFLNRFKTGLGDIFIPFDVNSISEDKNQLNIIKDLIKNQKDYLKMNFYFVSIDQNKIAKEWMYSTFPPASCDLPGNFFFLEGKNLQDGYRTFLENSYLKYKIIINNFNILFDKNYLFNQICLKKEKVNETI